MFPRGFILVSAQMLIDICCEYLSRNDGVVNAIEVKQDKAMRLINGSEPRKRSGIPLHFKHLTPEPPKREQISASNQVLCDFPIGFMSVNVKLGPHLFNSPFLFPDAMTEPYIVRNRAMLIFIIY